MTGKPESKLLRFTLFSDHIKQEMLIFEQQKSFYILVVDILRQVIPDHVSKAASPWVSHCSVDTMGYNSSTESVMNDYFGILWKGRGVEQQCSSAWLNMQTQIKTFGSTVKAPPPPPLYSSSRLHKSSLLHQQFPHCWDLKGASEHWELSAWCRIGVRERVRGENRIAFIWALCKP